MVGYLKLESRHFNKDPAAGLRRDCGKYLEKHRVMFLMSGILTGRWVGHLGFIAHLRAVRPPFLFCGLSFPTVVWMAEMTFP